MFEFLHPGVSVVRIVCCGGLGGSCVCGGVGRIAVCSEMIFLAVVVFSGLILVGMGFCMVG